MSYRSNVSILVRTADLETLKVENRNVYETAFCDITGELSPFVFFENYQADLEYRKDYKIIQSSNELLTLITLEDINFYGTNVARVILEFLGSLDYYELHILSEDDEGENDLEYLADNYTLNHGGLIERTDEVCVNAKVA